MRTERETFLTLDHPPTKTLSVIVPAHNEEDRLPGMLKETLAYLETKRTEADRQETEFRQLRHVLRSVLRLRRRSSCRYSQCVDIDRVLWLCQPMKVLRLYQ